MGVAKVVGLLAGAAVAGTVVVTAVVPAAATTDGAVVSKIVDGDTIDVRTGGRDERIRLLNVDAPETVDPDRPVQCMGPEASAFLARRIPVGTTVQLEFDADRVDRYGRTLAGVLTADGALVNADIARAGLGTAVVVGGNDRFYEAVLAAQREAAAGRRGMFSPTAGCAVAGRTEVVPALPATSAPPTSTSSALASRPAPPVTTPRAVPRPSPNVVPRVVPKPVAKPKPVPKPKPAPKPAPSAGSSANPYPGYTGPRCFAPGGKTWKPC